MPVYEYKCSACEHAGIDVKAMKDADPIGTSVRCPECGGMTFKRIVSPIHTDLTEFRKPIDMHSIAMNDDDEIAAFRQKCPGVDVSSDPHDEMYGVPVARNRSQKLAALRATGFVENN